MDAVAASYGIRITSALGFINSNELDPSDIINNGVRMTEDQFILYEKTNVFPHDVTQSEAIPQTEEEAVAQADEKANEDPQDKLLMYDKNKDEGNNHHAPWRTCC